jgi:hypothetical protein
MAIQKTFTDVSGAEHKDAYFRVNGIFIHREGNERVEIGMAAYVNKAASDARKQPLRGSTFGVTVASDEWSALKGADEVAKCYNFVKSRKPKMKRDDKGKETDEIEQGDVDLRGGKDV